MAMDNFRYAIEKIAGKIVLVKQADTTSGSVWIDQNNCYYDQDQLDFFNVEPNDARLEMQYVNEELAYWRNLRGDIMLALISQCDGNINYVEMEHAVEHIMYALREQDTSFWAVDTGKS